MAHPAGYQYYVEIEIATTANESDCVFDIDLSDAPAGFWSHIEKVDGSDVYPFDFATDTAWDRWLDDDWDAVANTGTIHIRADAVAGGTTLRIYYGFAGGAITNSVTTWTTAGYLVRLSCQEAAGNYVDSCGNYNGTPANVTYGQTGIMGLCGSYNDATSVVECGDITQEKVAANLTYEYWLNQTAHTGNDFVVFRGPAAFTPDASAIWARGGTNELRWPVVKGGSALNVIVSNYKAFTSFGTWWHLGCAFDGGAALGSRYKMYINGVRRDDSVAGTQHTTSPNYAGANPHCMGGDCAGTYSSWNGKMDEMRIATVTHSADFLGVSYNCGIKTVGYITWGAEVLVFTPGLDTELELESEIEIVVERGSEIEDRVERDSAVEIELVRESTLVQLI